MTLCERLIIIVFIIIIVVIITATAWFCIKFIIINSFI